jgi:hypothetical protein
MVAQMHMLRPRSELVDRRVSTPNEVLLSMNSIAAARLFQVADVMLMSATSHP